MTVSRKCFNTFPFTQLAQNHTQEINNRVQNEYFMVYSMRMILIRNLCYKSLSPMGSEDPTCQP